MPKPMWQPPRFLDEDAMRAWVGQAWDFSTNWWHRNRAIIWKDYQQAGAWLYRRVHRDATLEEALGASVTPGKLLALFWQYVLLPLFMLPFALVGVLWRWLGPMPLYLLALGGAIGVGLLLPAGFADYALSTSTQEPFFWEEVFRRPSMVYLGGAAFLALVVSAILLAVATVLLLQRFRAGRWLATAGGWMLLLGLVGLWWCCADFGQAMLDADVLKKADDVGPYIFSFKLRLAWALLPTGLTLFFSGLSAVETALRPRRVFTDEEKRQIPQVDAFASDRMLEWVRVNSQKRSLLKSSYYIGLAALLYSCGVMFYETFGCVQGYAIPLGSLQPKQQKVVPPKKIKKVLYLNPNSPIAMKVPKQMDMIKQLDEASQNTYTQGKIKEGKKGPAGFAGGQLGGVIRFIRLRHSGPGWDVGMRDSSDANMLKMFRTLTGGIKTASESEEHPAARLRKYQPYQKPPFVYITGYGHIGMSGSDKAALRKYLMEEGGMLFADSADARFGPAMRALLREVCPGKQLADISSDDDIFQNPFSFPDGAPPLWKHTGTRALGIRHNGRWIVFWHPGDMKDAWKTGHSGASKSVANLTYQLGTNVMVYAMNQYIKWVQAQKGMATEE